MEKAIPKKPRKVFISCDFFFQNRPVSIGSDFFLMFVVLYDVADHSPSSSSAAAVQ